MKNKICIRIDNQNQMEKDDKPNILATYFIKIVPKALFVTKI